MQSVYSFVSNKGFFLCICCGHFWPKKLSLVDRDRHHHNALRSWHEITVCYYYCFVCTFGLEEPLDGIQEDGEAEGEKEDSVVQCSQQLCSLPSVRQCWLPLCLCCQLSQRKNLSRTNCVSSCLLCSLDARVDATTEDNKKERERSKEYIHEWHRGR